MCSSASLCSLPISLSLGKLVNYEVISSHNDIRLAWAKASKFPKNVKKELIWFYRHLEVVTMFNQSSPSHCDTCDRLDLYDLSMEVFKGLSGTSWWLRKGASVTQDDTPDPLKASSQFLQPTCYWNLMSDSVSPFSVLHFSVHILSVAVSPFILFLVWLTLFLNKLSASFGVFPWLWGRTSGKKREKQRKHESAFVVFL